jgi:hypothetical protein
LRFKSSSKVGAFESLIAPISPRVSRFLRRTITFGHP